VIPDAKANETSQEYAGYFKSHVGARFTAEWVRRDARFVENQLRLVDRHLPLERLRSKPVLEVGSGTGRLFELLRRRGFDNYLGIELDPEAVEGSTHLFGAHFEQSRLCDHAPVHQGAYDTVFAFEVLEHLSDPISDIANIHAALTPGGHFVGTSPFPFRKNVMSDSTHLFVLHPENWRRLFENQGFEIVLLRAMTFLPMLWRVHGRLNVILPFYFRGLRLVSTTMIIARRGRG
jgi:SAM-dependent methyltransferase